MVTTLDETSEYWQIAINDKDVDKTAFVTHYGLFKYSEIPFGLKNAPETLQREIDVILASVNW